jgi:hypothetical protein
MNTWLPPLIISYRAYAIGGMCWAINWTVFPYGSGGFRLRRRVHRGPGILVPEEIPDDETREAGLSPETLADARGALERAWTTPPQGMGDKRSPYHLDQLRRAINPLVRIAGQRTAPKGVHCSDCGP